MLNYSKYRRICRFVLALLMLMVQNVLFSCSPYTGSLSGRISYKGQPLKGGTITFEGPYTYSASIDLDGRYEIPSMKAGNYRVAVETRSVRVWSEGGYSGDPIKGTSSKAIQSKGEKSTTTVIQKFVQEAETKPTKSGYYNPRKDPRYDPQNRYVPIPEKYADPTRSEIIYNFVGGNQILDIDLK